MIKHVTRREDGPMSVLVLQLTRADTNASMAEKGVYAERVLLFFEANNYAVKPYDEDKSSDHESSVIVVQLML